MYLNTAYVVRNVATSIKSTIFSKNICTANAIRAPYRVSKIVSEHNLKASKTKVDGIQNKLLSDKSPSVKAVVFDKDGTLICFDSLWVPWAKELASNLSKNVNLDISDKILDLMGVCSKTYKTSPGLLAEGTKFEICKAIEQLLIKHNVDQTTAHRVTLENIQFTPIRYDNLNNLCNLSEIFTILRQHDIRIGVCTSDIRTNTLKCLSDLDVLHLIDVIVCGDDTNCRPKPEPDGGRLICKKLQLPPEQVAMVGDTKTDILFAKNSNFGLSVGVLSGIGQRADLEKAWYGADEIIPSADRRFHILPSVADVIPLVLPDVPIHVGPSKSRFPVVPPVTKDTCSQKHKLIVMDKDGTLTNVHPRWSKWAEELAARLQSVSSKDVAEQFLEIIGYSPETRRASGGMLAESSMLHIKECMSYLLTLNGKDLVKSTNLVEQIWFVPDLSSADLIPGITEAISVLRKAGFMLALNSSDVRDACKNFLDVSGLVGQFDVVLSAEDAGRHPKPLPHTLLKIMKTVGCRPEETVVVGDCPADLLAGHSAGVALTVGVLSGFSVASNLLPHASVLLPNFTYFSHLLEQQQKISNLSFFNNSV